MAPIITENIEQIISACERHKVKYLYVFGSAARESDFKEDSDVDFLYAFDKERIQLDDYADNYFEFLFGLEDLFNRNIDLLPDESITNPFLLKTINNDKIKLYAFAEY